MKTSKQFRTPWICIFFTCLILSCSDSEQGLLVDNGFNSDYVCSFARVYGYARYFHPTDESINLDWDKFLIYGLNHLKEIKDDSHFLLMLKGLFEPICYDIKFSHEKLKNDTIEELNLNDKYYVHFGLYESDKNIYKKFICTPYSCETENSAPNKSINKKVGKKIWVKMPMAVPSNYFLVHDSLFFAKIGLTIVNYYNADDQITQLASFIKTWNIYAHFYPYQETIDMDNLLTTNIEKILSRPLTTITYGVVLSEFVSEMNDGHGSVQHKSLMNDIYYLPFSCERIEGKICVVNSTDSRIKLGDIILSIDGVLAENILNTQLKLTSGSVHRKEDQGLKKFYPIRSKGGPISSMVVIKRGDTILCVENVKRGKNIKDSKLYLEKSTIKKLAKNLFYVNISSLNNVIWDKWIDSVKDQDIIFDYRGYPNSMAAWNLPGHLTSLVIKSPLWEIPIITEPNWGRVKFDTSRWEIYPLNPKFTGRIIFLTNEEAISAAETQLDIISHYNLGSIVGSNTAGINGNVNRFVTPGGYHVYFTGMRVRKRDGSRLHLEGITPNYFVEQSLDGVRNRRDDVLEFAINMLTGLDE